MIAPNVSFGDCAPGANSALCAGSEERQLAPGGSERATLSPTGHLVVAVCLGCIGTFGLLNNLLVLVLFCRYKTLRSPINMLLINISFSDLLVCVLGTPFSFAASTQGRWLIGHAGCVWYGFANSLFGIVSLISLAALSFERYSTMMGCMEADVSNYRKVSVGIAVSWGYSLLWTTPPLLGWSRYGPEGPGTTCSVDWTGKSANNISYIVCLFVFCLLVPFLVIVVCYGKLLQAIKQVSGINRAVSRKREQRVLCMVVVMVACYLMCWMPYGIMALVATFGPPGLITPEASIVPSILAKTSTVINPVIYIFMNKQFYRCFWALWQCKAPQRGSSIRSSSKIATKIFRGRAAEHNLPFMVATLERQAVRPVPAVAALPKPDTPEEEAAVDASEGPSVDASEGPSVNTPEDPSVNAPEGPSVNAPEDPSVNAPEGPSVNAPEDPSVNAPEDPSVNAPEDPSVNAPEGPSVNAPEDPSVNAPEDPSVNAPEGPSEAVKPAVVSLVAYYNG